ncbi:MAG: hypothetical protein J6F30_04660 [Cellulosilyticum sp.]|nr:hypothetical protein [Cellulosilyticum sp.]
MKVEELKALLREMRSNTVKASLYKDPKRDKKRVALDIILMSLDDAEVISRNFVHNLIAEMLSESLTEEERKRLEKLDMQITEASSLVPRSFDVPSPVESDEEYVSRKELIEEIGRIEKHYVFMDANNSPNKESGWKLDLVPVEVVKDMFNNMAPVPLVQNKTTHWVVIDDETDECICYACKGTVEPYHKYCPNCGRKKIGVERKCQ